VREADIHFKHKFMVADEPADFWGWIDGDKWEPGTFEIFERYLTPETNFIDVGPGSGRQFCTPAV